MRGMGGGVNSRPYFIVCGDGGGRGEKDQDEWVDKTKNDPNKGVAFERLNRD